MLYDRNIKKLAGEFRKYIESAREKGLFDGDVFEFFPEQCCGDTSCILAEYLLANDIETIIVSGEDEDGESHAWLVVKDERVNVPKQQLLEAPDYIKGIWNSYRACEYDEPIDITHYSEEDILGGLVIDITADQFGEAPIFVDYANGFYKRFEFVQAKDFVGLYDDRLINLYNMTISMKSF